MQGVPGQQAPELERQDRPDLQGHNRLVLRGQLAPQARVRLALVAPLA